MVRSAATPRVSNHEAAWMRRHDSTQPENALAVPGYTSRLSIAKRTSSEDERRPSFWRMMEDVLAIVL